ncbi:hypothetical protein AN639_00620 [Candidatus Epulonipiscium fishelsonii]|uniref:Uncharacterized protein n=1 Tax=Candidatus Epulonipiscium fishelsonii TaxID=77094 RepID=A0ACC8XBQ5_9FIRM|nr:hypothetical protein AN396_07280 [Epulopiscium sp. SCG-B11WGA-EpuloA1]ONI41304.1 hypothetical protein AN639_00620 [Epulopiscium sp. SCG-B05WGA-EpuloA1]ONI47729.1 hypothetical protein AN644_04115 [Epulopiscium sp. SCG-C06WGA-EpuloA1]
MNYPKINYDYEKIKLKKIYENEKLKDFTDYGIETPESKMVYGDLKFPPLLEDRAYTMASFVTSIDGKLAYIDNPAGPVIASSNVLDPDGGMADFWILNLMRATADAVFVGTGTMHKEPNSTISLFDQNLENARVKLGKTPTPWAIVCSAKGSSIPFEDELFNAQPVMINTSHKGFEFIKNNIKQEYYLVGEFKTEKDIDKQKIKQQFQKFKYKKIPVIVTGEGGNTNTTLLLKVLKLLEIDRVMVESPQYCHSMLQDGLLDESVINYSCVYVGGTAVGFGQGMEACTSIRHPHSELLSIHMHSPSFMYLRHKFIYNY